MNIMSLATFVVLVVVQIVFWPLLHFTVPSITVALATPLFAFVPSGIAFRLLRKRELDVFAQAHGFTVIDDPDWAVPDLNIAPFTIGRARRQRIRSGMTGRVGDYDAWYIFYTWLNNNWIQFSTHYRHVAVLRLPRALPPLSIGPTISTAAGPTVKFESITFNEQWWVTCPDATFAKAALPPVTLDRLLATDIPVTATTRIAIVGENLVAISFSGTRAGDLHRLFDVLRIVAEGIAPYVWEEYGQ